MTTRPQGLRRFAAPARPAPEPAAEPDSDPTGGGAAQERCEMCGTDVSARHGHVVDLEHRSIACACRACYLLFTSNSAGVRYRSIPERYLHDPSRPPMPTEWEQLQIPVGTAFFLTTVDADNASSVAAFYPSPAGATECLLDLEAWARMVTDHPLLAMAQPDVEAIVIRCTDAERECYLVPIDACYELVGRVRMYWQGFDGGAEARASIDEFFTDLRTRAALFVGGG